MEGMIGELKIADLMGSTAIEALQPGVYVEEMSASAAQECADDPTDGVASVDDTQVHFIAKAQDGPEAMAARTKADILLESIARSEQSPADSFYFADSVPQADGGDEDGTIVWELGEGAFAGTDPTTGFAPIEIALVCETETNLAGEASTLIISDDA